MNITFIFYLILNGRMERTLIFKSNMSPISSLRRRSSCYNIQRAEERDRRKSSKFECAWKCYRSINRLDLVVVLFGYRNCESFCVLVIIVIVLFAACQKIVGTRLSASSQCLSGGSRPVTPQPLVNSPSHNHSTFLYKVIIVLLLPSVRLCSVKQLCFDHDAIS